MCFPRMFPSLGIIVLARRTILSSLRTPISSELASFASEKYIILLRRNKRVKWFFFLSFILSLCFHTSRYTMAKHTETLRQSNRKTISFIVLLVIHRSKRNTIVSLSRAATCHPCRFIFFFFSELDR